ncbi:MULTISPECIES: hypothetical protein [Enterobacter cloacae complex]|uniref:hypothetical protein n=1 Tax=Enterobacter cloacae complex TaxID=354276 RepID=UPI0003B7A727|nr:MULTISPECIES: hypothetical protein [Enterobacter cloacae complex]ERP03850.1 hypothetical protein L354_02890 [Enterobacter sp. MGH 8]EUM59097.1 hypothetical protein L358_04408 [Enterobacter sp. MGH 12]EUM67583.1 hypothetical protein L357_01390 [Enterobacter sp. MGH 11]MBW7715437.1 hypothetical protein [Enterobacter kobei]MBW7720752.1 hypothetical protein [Enterobacter kobei]
MITEKNNVFYCDCGFSFQRGRSGSHDCADGLRNKLAKSEARCAALAAENAGLKDAISCHAAGFIVCEACGEENISGNDDVCRALNETPATDAFLAEVRAQGLEMFAAVLRRKGDDAFFDAIAEAQANAADQFAAQLRKGVQS